LQPTTDHEALFARLALQGELVTEAELAAAKAEQGRDRTRSLGQILLAQGVLREKELAALEALDDCHRERYPHAQKAKGSTIAAPHRERYQNAQATFETCSLPKVSLEDPYQTRMAAGPGVDGSTGGAPVKPRYHVLRPHARGGLGEVFVALDEELGREVALKEIRPEHADNTQNRGRFIKEGEVTGRLEHPGIVPVYGLGHHPDGRPFYAMRLIRGESLQQAIDRFHDHHAPMMELKERSRELRHLLRRFVDVCNAVAYAHSKGVLHRDLKPGNIMLGPYGETLIVDWGLAKVVGVAEEGLDAALPVSGGIGGSNAGTVPGSLVGTPAYMSPEQASGELDRLGPASDIYSLGATLYSVLTGKSPFAAPDLAEVLRQVRQGEFKPPATVNPQVHTNLQAICLKAMALRSEDRYSSARDLADDIEQWLADEPVLGYRDVAFSISPEGTFTSLTPAFESLYGWSRADWLGNPFPPIVHPDDLPLCLDLFTRAVQGETPPVFETRILKKSGVFVWAEVMCILQFSDERVVQVMGLIRPSSRTDSDATGAPIATTSGPTDASA
jgi:eukaryotic-like serine/threonine-protein kinase